MYFFSGSASQAQVQEEQEIEEQVPEQQESKDNNEAVQVEDEADALNEAVQVCVLRYIQ